MNSKFDPKEYKEFLNNTPIQPPHFQEQIIFKKVKSDLQVSPLSLGTKILGLHFATSIFTLSICPQFGFRIFGEGMGLMHYFMDLGDIDCQIACGSFYLGSSLLAMVLTLKQNEIYLFLRHRILTTLTLGLFSLGFFIMQQPEAFISGLTFAWFFGAVLGAISVSEIGLWLKRKFRFSFSS